MIISGEKIQISQSMSPNTKIANNNNKKQINQCRGQVEVKESRL